jgi:hypothetical protein
MTAICLTHGVQNAKIRFARGTGIRISLITRRGFGRVMHFIPPLHVAQYTAQTIPVIPKRLVKSKRTYTREIPRSGTASHDERQRQKIKAAN